MLVRTETFRSVVAAPAFTVAGVDFDGSSWLERDGDLTGNADGKQFFCSMWICPDSVGNDNLYSTGNNQILVGLTSDGRFRISGENAAGTTIIDIRSPAGSIVSGGCQHVCGSFDTADTGRRWIRVDGANQALSVFAHTDDTVDWTQADHAVGANPGAGGLSFDGGIAEYFIGHFWVPNTDANVLKFISALSTAGVPVDLGSDGTIPGLGTPKIWLTRRAGGSVADFISNNGTGGGFTEKGALTLADRGIVT